MSTIRGLENGSRSAGPVALAKLAEALECPQVVLEAGQIDAVAASAVSALELLVGLLRISDPAYVTRRRGFVRLGFAASGRNIGTLYVQAHDFDELVDALRRHSPDRHGPHQPTGSPGQRHIQSLATLRDSSTDVAALKS